MLLNGDPAAVDSIFSLRERDPQQSFDIRLREFCGASIGVG
jgi:hypothetical protein